MAVAFTNVSPIAEQAPDELVTTFSYTVGSGSNRFLIVGFSIREANAGTTTSVTYNGVSLTLYKRVATNTGAQAEVWYLVAPPSGANNVVITRTAFDQIAPAALDFENVDQGTPLDAVVFNSVDTYTADNSSVVLPSAVGDMTFSLVAFGDDEVQTVSTNQTNRVNGHGYDQGTQDGASILGIDTAAGSASNTHTWTLSVGDLKSAHIGGNINAVAGGGVVVAWLRA